MLPNSICSLNLQIFRVPLHHLIIYMNVSYITYIIYSTFLHNLQVLVADIFRTYFPTCQVRVVRFYVNSRASSFSSFSFSASPPPPRTSTTTIHAQCSLPDLNRQKICQIECQKIWQIECQKIWQIECQKICQIECQIERQKQWQIERQIQWQIECQRKMPDKNAR